MTQLHFPKVPHSSNQSIQSGFSAFSSFQSHIYYKKHQSHHWTIRQIQLASNTFHTMLLKNLIADMKKQCDCSVTISKKKKNYNLLIKESKVTDQALHIIVFSSQALQPFNSCHPRNKPFIFPDLTSANLNMATQQPLLQHLNLIAHYQVLPL